MKKCEECDGTGEREINVDGADCPQACCFCDGSGVAKSHSKNKRVRKVHFAPDGVWLSPKTKCGIPAENIIASGIFRAVTCIRCIHIASVDLLKTGSKNEILTNS